MTRALLSLLAVVALGCTTAPDGTSPPFVRFVPLDVMPGTGLGNAGPGGCGSVAFADLRLRGDAARVPAVWVDVVGEEIVLQVRWPPGFTARFEPELVLYDAHRRPVAINGDILTDGDGYPGDPPDPITLLSFNGVDFPCE
ncbi:MAG TPA: hypothetical protein VM344_00415 [Vitreimonas sp.]|nr:hypothetical protein [Vitreimonas sp.]